MKKISFAFILIALALIACKQKPSSKLADAGFLPGNDTTHYINPADTNKRTTIQWIDTLKELGTLEVGGPVEVLFRFKNTGTKPLSINEVSAGCGCTSPQKPDGLIAPGKEGAVKAKFKTENQNGVVRKHITVVANTNPQSYELYFTATVNPKK
jgi:Protein of unknown function (DUF1573)